ncbi:hypothetical protein ACFW04_002653 [Cataglyphis niger]
MDTISICGNSKNTKKHSKRRQLEDITVNDNTIEETFPWLLEFNKIVCSSTGNRSYRHLERLLLLYTQNVLSSVKASNVKFNNTINLKNNINNILIFFHLYWLDIKQEIVDHSSYLNKMSTLLSIYIDMETSRQDMETSRQEIVKILAALYIYLNNSEEHIFRVLLRIKHMTEKYTQICNHIFMKNFSNLKIKTTSLTDVAYIRYLLAFKMWRNMENLSEEKREEIDKLALMLLGPRMPKLRDELSKFVPRPKNQKNETLCLLKSNLFEMYKHFLLFEDEMDKHFLLLEDKMDKYSLLLEDKIDNSADLQYTKVVYVGQNCLKSQKHPMSLLHRSNPNRSIPTSNQEVNKDFLNSLQNDNMPLSMNGNKSLEQTYLQKKERRNLKSLKQEKKENPGEPEVIDLTEDDEILCETKRKKIKHNLDKITKQDLKIMKNKKYINSIKHSSGFMANVNTEKSSNRDSKSTVEKVRLKYKSIPNNKISDSTESYTSISNRLSLNNNHHINLQKSEHLNVIKNQMNSTYPEFVKENETQFDNSHYIKSSMFVDRDIKEFNVTTNVLKENKPENISSHMTYMTADATGLYKNIMMQSKETLTSQEENVIPLLKDIIPLLNMCQNDIVDQHSFKQEIPISPNCNTTQNSYKCWETTPRDIKYLRIQKLKSINDHNSQVTDYFITCHQGNEYEECCTKSDCKPFVFPNSNDSTTQEHNTFSDDKNDVKLSCNTKIILPKYNLHQLHKYNILTNISDCNAHYVAHHIDDIVIMTCCNMHDEKIMQCLYNSNDMYTTFNKDQIVESSLNDQNVNLDNKRKYDYGHGSKHSETTITMIKTQQERSDCGTSMSNDQLHLSERFLFNIDSIDMDSKEANEIMKNCINDSENISFLHNPIEILESLENVVSKETTDFLLSSKQSPFELDNVYTNTFLRENHILCNNQNNAINSNVNPIAFHLNNITTNNTFL